MDTPCTVRERGFPDPIHGFDEDQRRQLVSRKKKNTSEVDRWKEVYSILFRIPIDSPDMPSPCECHKLTIVNSTDPFR